MKTRSSYAFILFSLFIISCSPRTTSYEWNLPEGVTPPPVPEWNPLTVEKVELGRILFYSKDLSQDGTMSCASCHVQEYAFSDRKGRPRGIPDGKGQLHPRNSQHLSNAAYYSVMTWANPVLRGFEEQNAVPLFFTANAVKELGLEGEGYLRRLRQNPKVLKLFQKVFDKTNPEEAVTEFHMRQALAAFQRTLVGFDSPYDRYERGDKKALSESAKRGMDLFFSKKTDCSVCHPAPHFTDATYDRDKILMHNNGLYSVADYGKKELGEKGLMEFTLDQRNEGTFRAPSLRNIAVTFPYMHDGSIACDGNLASDDEKCARQALSRVIDHYSRGGKKHPHQDKTIHGFEITDGEKSDLIDFLFSLTDGTFLHNPAFSDPGGAAQ